jgi:P27 family predicted phage terminase small subunit
MGGIRSGGHNRKATAIKKREGNRGHRKLNENEAKANTGEPEMPKFVASSPIARAEWKRLVPLLLEMKVLSKVDGPALGGLCAAYAQLVLAEAAIAKFGIINVTLDQLTGVAELKTSPAVRIKSDAMRHLRAACGQFGLDPVSRTRIQVKASDTTQDPLDDFFGGKDSGEVVQ